MKATLMVGDCRVRLAELADASIDAVVHVRVADARIAHAGGLFGSVVVR